MTDCQSQHFVNPSLVNNVEEKPLQNVESILSSFGDIPDPRSHVNQVHLFGDLLVICIMAVIAGADGPQAIGVWASNNEQWLRKRLKLPNGIPSHDTLGRLLAAIKPDAFQKCFEEWIQSLAPLDEGSPSNQIAVDGKVLKRSHDQRKGLGPLWLVSAWAVDRSISLGQLATDEKSNEITAIPDLLDNIELKDSVVTIDAAGCQKAIVRKIIAAKADFVLALKGNQKTLHEAVTSHIATQMENDFADVTARRHVETFKGHGRTDQITYYQLPVPNDLPGLKQWSGLKTIGVAIRESEGVSESSSDVRYFISSLPLGVKAFARYVRGHWSIETTLHWCLDVTFREDESRVRDRTLANNLAWLKRFTISLLKQQDDKYSIAMRRRAAGWNNDYLAKVLGIPL